MVDQEMQATGGKPGPLGGPPSPASTNVLPEHIRLTLAVDEQTGQVLLRPKTITHHSTAAHVCLTD